MNLLMTKVLLSNLNKPGFIRLSQNLVTPAFKQVGQVLLQKWALALNDLEMIGVLKQSYTQLDKSLS